MTTVINFNFLNFFRLKLNNNITLNNDARSYNQYLIDNRRQNFSFAQDGVNDVIDITPYNPALVGNRDNTGRPHREIEKRSYFTDPAKIENTYNRKGKAEQGVDAKGLLIDSYA